MCIIRHDLYRPASEEVKGVSRAPRPFDSKPDLPEGTVDSHGTPVTPKSLYLAQLGERLDPQAVKNIGYLELPVRGRAARKVIHSPIGN
ncbi:MAG: hypothetical protein GEV06_06630 [Luteitalea sp.]|nr:hypothetical protein [Luteitalea sp.]